MGLPADTLVLYGLIRTDMASMNPGKLAAQAFHAARHADQEIKDEALYGAEWVAKYRDWCAQTPQKFGTVLTLDVNNAETVHAVVAFAKKAGFPAGVTHDPSYPLVDGRCVHLLPVDTLGWVFGAKGDLEALLVRFGLCP